MSDERTTSSDLASARQSTTAGICAASSSVGRNLHDPEQQQASQNNPTDIRCPTIPFFEALVCQTRKE